MFAKLVKWVREAYVEWLAKEYNLTPVVTTGINVKDIDLSESLRRQSRLGRHKDDDLVAQYACALVRAPFHMIVLMKIGNVYVILGGVHRFCAFLTLEGAETITAYVVDEITDTLVADIFPRLLNRGVGRGLMKDEMLESARGAIETNSLTAEEVAKQYFVPLEWVRDYMRTSRIKARIRAIGVNPEGMADSILEKLRLIDNNKNVLRAAARCIQKHRIKGARAFQLVDEIRAAETEADKLDVVNRTEAEIEAVKPPPGPVKTPVRTRILRGAPGMLKLLGDKKDWNQCQITNPIERKNVGDWFKLLIKHMTRILKSGRKRGG
jgi:hypothetical protein